ncbi:zinc finger (CCCH type) motif-containing protein [Toxoplasma gondii MAS]|uniref:Zinc finger (CCCH type) motif-containing protein n=1 Tax=Toxoplasma gondii MAS TaxID=943118 RepID=A0A086PKW2_TOXGO|nr:zinc finger (CCCH type) motif-containing protein [Toxoplasma gondii MAS]
MEGLKEVPVSGAFAESAHFPDGRPDPASLELNSSALTRLNLFVKFYKTKICPFYKKKRCEWGHDCKFAHGRKELRSGPDLSKTRMCPSLQRRGRCDKGDACRFAHHQGELRDTSELYTNSLYYHWMLGNCRSNKWHNAHGEAEKKDEIRRRRVSMEKLPSLPPAALATIKDAAVSPIPEARQFSASLPAARHVDNEEVEFCFRFWVPRGAVVRLKSLQPGMECNIPCEDNVTDIHRVDAGIDAALFKTLTSSPPGVSRMVPDYPSRDIPSFEVTSPPFPQHPLLNARGPGVPPVQPQPDIMPIDLLPKFLSASLGVESPTSEHETRSPSSGSSSPEFVYDFPHTPVDFRSSDHDLRFLPTRLSHW